METRTRHLCLFSITVGLCLTGQAHGEAYQSQRSRFGVAAMLGKSAPSVAAALSGGPAPQPTKAELAAKKRLGVTSSLITENSIESALKESERFRLPAKGKESPEYLKKIDELRSQREQAMETLRIQKDYQDQLQKVRAMLSDIPLPEGAQDKLQFEPVFRSPRGQAKVDAGIITTLREEEANQAYSQKEDQPVSQAPQTARGRLLASVGFSGAPSAPQPVLGARDARNVNMSSSRGGTAFQASLAYNSSVRGTTRAMLRRLPKEPPKKKFDTSYVATYRHVSKSGIGLPDRVAPNARTEKTPGVVGLVSQPNIARPALSAIPAPTEEVQRKPGASVRTYNGGSGESSDSGSGD